MIYPVSLSGEVLLSDGRTTKFQVSPDTGFMQWGADTEHLGATVDLMEALSGALYEHARPIPEEGS
jgi:hypothetical protein